MMQNKMPLAYDNLMTMRAMSVVGITVLIMIKLFFPEMERHVDVWRITFLFMGIFGLVTMMFLYACRNYPRH